MAVLLIFLQQKLFSFFFLPGIGASQTAATLVWFLSTKGGKRLVHEIMYTGATEASHVHDITKTTRHKMTAFMHAFSHY